MNSHEVVENVLRGILPGRYPIPDDCHEDYAVTELMRHRTTLERAAWIFLEASDQDAESAMRHLFNLLLFLDSNAKPSRDAKAIRTYESLDWEQRRRDAVASVRNAADLLDDPVQGSDRLKCGKLLGLPSDDPLRINMSWMPEEPVTVDAVARLVELDLLPTVLRRMADAIDEIGSEAVMPLGARTYERNSYGVRSELIGKRGGAGDPEGASRALIIKELDKRLPQKISNRYSLIADLIAITGDDVSRQLVRSVLLRGHT
jgi:hypothetical protein